MGEGRSCHAMAGCAHAGASFLATKKGCSLKGCTPYERWRDCVRLAYFLAAGSEKALMAKLSTMGMIVPPMPSSMGPVLANESLAR